MGKPLVYHETKFFKEEVGFRLIRLVPRLVETGEEINILGLIRHLLGRFSLNEAVISLFRLNIEGPDVGPLCLFEVTFNIEPVQGRPEPHAGDVLRGLFNSLEERDEMVVSYIEDAITSVSRLEKAAIFEKTDFEPSGLFEKVVARMSDVEERELKMPVEVDVDLRRGTDGCFIGHQVATRIANGVLQRFESIIEAVGRLAAAKGGGNRKFTVQHSCTPPLPTGLKSPKGQKWYGTDDLTSTNTAERRVSSIDGAQIHSHT